MLKWFRISLAVEVAVLLVSGGAVAWYLWHGGEVSARMSAKSTRYARSHDELLSRQTLRYTSDIHHPSTLQSENRVSLFCCAMDCTKKFFGAKTASVTGSTCRRA